MLQVLAGEARPVAAEVALVELVGRGEAPREEAAAERRVGDERDAQLFERRQDLRLDVARPQRVLGLHRRDRVHRVRAADRLRARLREAEVADLALPRRARPSRRPCPRSACSGRRGAGSRGRCARRPGARSEASHAAAHVLGAAVDRAHGGPPSAPGSILMPNLVARKTSSRRPAIALPTSRSLVCGPYMSEVSRKLQPSSSARGSCAAPRLRRSRRRTPTCPCSRARSPRPRGRPVQACVSHGVVRAFR